MVVYKKTVATEILISILAVSVFVLIGSSYFGTVQAATDVTGIITADTTWTKANSPYTLTGPVRVNNGVTLTIEPGVTVVLDYYIEVNGTLCARGSNTDPIYINATLEDSLYNEGYITFTQFSSNWDEETGSGCIIENAVLTSTLVSIHSFTKINNNTLAGNIVMHYIIDAESGVISNNTVKVDYGCGICCSGDALVSDNTVIGGVWGGIFVPAGSPIIQRNLVKDNVGSATSVGEGGGILLRLASGYQTTPLIQNNTIVNNEVGITINSGVTPTIANNNIYNNEHNVYLKTADNISATYNWWGTTDTQTINQTIHDFKNDFNLGTVDFVPFLDAPNPEAPADPDPPVAPEFPYSIALSPLIVATLIGALLFKRKGFSERT